MNETANIRLKFVKTDWHEYMWLLLYEFEIRDSKIFKRTNHEILETLMQTRIFNNSLYHLELENEKLEISKEALKKGITRPFIFDQIELTDFCFIPNLIAFKNWVANFRLKGWEDDRDDAQLYMDRAEKIILDRMNFKDGVWLLSKEKFPNRSSKLSETHWIYLHFECFIEIDRQAKVIRTLDFGYD